MTSLRTVLNKYADTNIPGAPLGSDETDQEEKPQKRRVKGPDIDKANLRKDLEAVKKDNSRYFVVCVVMIVLLFIISIIVVLTNLAKPDIIKIAMTAFGISTAGLITLMIKLWRTKSNTEMLILLAINMDAETIKSVINILAKRV
jgi:hypothetical protein